MTDARRIGGILIAAAALLAPATASANWTINGHGFGHGVGLSQYGAFGFAKHGRDYRQIVSHYYTATKLGKEGGQVRVLLGAGEGSVEFKSARQACGRSLDQKRRYSFAVRAGEVVLSDSGGHRIAGCGQEGAAGSGVTIEGLGRYRGELVARATGANILVINAVGVEDYVKGVVANESPSSWPAAALQAQAVAARSYGLATDRGGPFDQYADTRSQVYGGKGTETKATNRAVEATAHQVVTYKGEVATTYYFSTSGGQTENSEFGLGGEPVPYLKSVDDPYDDASPVHDWHKRLSDDQMDSALGGLFTGRLERIKVTRTGVSPRIVRARVIGTRGSSTVSGATLRSRLGLMSTWARFSHR